MPIIYNLFDGHIFFFKYTSVYIFTLLKIGVDLYIFLTCTCSLCTNNQVFNETIDNWLNYFKKIMPHTWYDLMISYRLWRLIKASKIIHTYIKRQIVSHDDLKKRLQDSRIYPTWHNDIYMHNVSYVYIVVRVDTWSYASAT